MTGLPHTGTTALTRVLAAYGYDLGADLFDPSFLAGAEHRPSKFWMEGREGAEEPTEFPELVKVPLEASWVHPPPFHPDRVVVTNRDPDEWFRSYSCMRPNLPPDASSDLYGEWYGPLADSMIRLAPTVFVDFPRWVTDFGYLRTCLRAVCPDGDRLEAAWGSVADRQHVYFSPT